MFYRQKTLGRMGIAPQPAATTMTIPASTTGVNALDPLISQAPTDCYYTYNLVPSEYGLRLRRGYREYCTGIGTNDEVRCVIPFEGTNPANNKLFVATTSGIYDCTTDGDTSPSLVQAFSSSFNDAGFCTWAEFTTDAANTYLFVACPENGLYQYDEATGTWARPAFTGGSTPAMADLAFVGLHKQRLWFVEKDTTDAWYSGVASVSGALTIFTFGSKFEYGGKLMGVYTWSLDGGNGLDDYLVAVSRGGDVLAYRGPDPSDASWSLTGSFFVGAMPDSRRAVIPQAGELYILSTFGITSLRDLLMGVAAFDTGRGPSAKINRVLRPKLLEMKDDYGWELRIFPADGFLQIVQPWDYENEAVMYVQNLLTKAWGYWDNVPMICADTWQGDYYLGSTDGRLFIYEGVLDNTTIAGGGGDAIEFNILTSFQALGNHALHKQVGIIRVVDVSGGQASYNIKAIYDYDLSPAIADPAAAATLSASLWDAAVWDSSIWDGELNGNYALEGAAGIGRTVAIGMKGEAASRLTIVGWDVTFTGGGFL